jgi:tetratricopeptide (TPR) repeat protein
MEPKMKTVLASIALLAPAGIMAQTPLQQAAKLTDNERFEHATAAIKAVLAAEPNNGEAWFLLGENYYYNDKLDSARMAYSRGAEVNPLMPLNAVGLGKVLQAQGRTDEARAAFEAAIANAIDKKTKMPKPMQASVYREAAEGLVYGDVKDPAKAVTYADAAIALNPADAEAYIVRGDALFEMNPRDLSEPMAMYKKAADLSGNNAKPIARRGLVYYRAKNFDASVAEYDNAIRIDPDFAPAYSGRAEAYYFKRDFAKATADYDKYLELNKGNESARVRYAQFLFLVENFSESLALINELEAAGVKNNVLARLKGYNMVELKDTVNALPTIEAYMAARSEDELISSDMQYYARAIALLGNDSLAAEKLLAAARMKNADPELYTEAAKLFYKARMYSNAAEAYLGKVTHGKAEVNDWYYLGDAANRGKLFSLADSAWAKYTQYQPNIYQGYLGRARANVGLDSTRTTWQARPYFEEVLRKMTPEDIAKSPMVAEEAYFYLGFYHFYGTKDMPAAKCWFEKVVALNAGTSSTKTANDMVKGEALKDVRATPCELP